MKLFVVLGLLMCIALAHASGKLKYFLNYTFETLEQSLTSCDFVTFMFTYRDRQYNHKKFDSKVSWNSFRKKSFINVFDL